MPTVGHFRMAYRRADVACLPFVWLVLVQVIDLLENVLTPNVRVAIFREMKRSVLDHMRESEDKYPNRLSWSEFVMFIAGCRYGWLWLVAWAALTCGRDCSGCLVCASVVAGVCMRRVCECVSVLVFMWVNVMRDCACLTALSRICVGAAVRGKTGLASTCGC